MGIYLALRLGEAEAKLMAKELATVDKVALVYGPDEAHA